MDIRKANAGDLQVILMIYKRARAFMEEHGNPHQWGPTHWPTEHLLRKDIEIGRLFVCVESAASAEGERREQSRVVGVFCYICGDHEEPGYDHIEDGR